MSEIRKVDLEEMSNQAKTLDTLAGKWNLAVGDITKLKQELDDMWDGLANSSFNMRWENDLNKYNSLLTVIENYRNAIADAVSKYSAGENEIASIVKD